MALRKNLYNFFIWLAVIGFSIWIGGTIFSMCVVVPMWSESPESIKEFFGGTNFNKYILNFFAPWLGSIRLFPLLISLGLIWYSKKHRYYLLITLLTLLFTIIYTNIVIYPINDIMMTKAGAGKTAEELKIMADKWIIADHLRFAVVCVGYFFLLKAFRLPTPEARKV